MLLFKVKQKTVIPYSSINSNSPQTTLHPSSHHQNAPFYIAGSSMKNPPRFAGVSPENDEIVWEMRPGGMFVQKREVGVDGPMMKIGVTHGPSHHELYLPAQSTFCESLFSLQFTMYVGLLGKFETWVLVCFSYYCN